MESSKPPPPPSLSTTLSTALHEKEATAVATALTTQNLLKSTTTIEQLQQMLQQLGIQPTNLKVRVIHQQLRQWLNNQQNDHDSSTTTLITIPTIAKKSTFAPYSLTTQPSRIFKSGINNTGFFVADFTLDGKYIFATLQDGSLAKLDSIELKLIKQVGIPYEIVMGENDDASRIEYLLKPEEISSPGALAIHPKGLFVVQAASSQGNIIIRNASPHSSSNEIVQSIKCHEAFENGTALCFNATGTVLASRANSFDDQDASGSLAIIALKFPSSTIPKTDEDLIKEISWEIIGKIPVQANYTMNMCFHGSLLFVGSIDGILVIDMTKYDGSTKFNDIHKKLQHHQHHEIIHITPAGDYGIVSCATDCVVHLMDCTGEQVVKSLHQPYGQGIRIICIAASDQSHVVATGSENRTLTIWSLPDLIQICSVDRAHSLNSIAFNPKDGGMSFITTGDSLFRWTADGTNSGDTIEYWLTSESEEEGNGDCDHSSGGDGGGYGDEGSDVDYDDHHNNVGGGDV
jgi:WD40 repeat protein